VAVDTKHFLSACLGFAGFGRSAEPVT